jgi:mono/diheme cytochrome c family protein
MSLGHSRGKLLGLSLVGIVVSLAAACGVGALGATDANLAAAKSRASTGADLFAQQCAGCHGQRGEGHGRNPAVIGAGALPMYPRDKSDSASATLSDPNLLEEEARNRPAGAPTREPFRTAESVYQYVSKNMPNPPERAGSLAPDQYWAIINFMLVAHGSAVPEGGITAANAGSVQVEPQ